MPKASVDELAFRERTRREILNRADRIPPLPDVVVRVLALLNDPKTTPEQLEQALLDDQVLVGRVLGMVNSPFYGINRRIVAVKDAIMVLGFRGLRSLLLTASTAACLERDFRCFGHGERGLWQHSLAVATGAATLAGVVELDPRVRDEVFVAGLLHDIGKMPLAPYMIEHSVLRSRDPARCVERERTLIGVDHTEAGALVCAKWNLSEVVQDIVKNHHAAKAPPDLQACCAVVRLSDALAHERGTGYLEGEAPQPELREADRELLGLDEAAWAEARARVDEAVDKALDALAQIPA